MVTAGDVDIRLSERGCSGVVGDEIDRRNAFLFAVFASSPPAAALLDGVAGGDFAASPRDFSVTLITCVASIAFSFADSSSLPSPLAAAFVVFEVAFVEPFAFDFDPRTVFVARESLFRVSEVSSLSLGTSKSLRRTVVVGEHVDIEDTALLTASVCECKAAMEKFSEDDL